MKKNIKLNCPTYLNEFKCIGGDCSDSCCIGWDVDIDKATFKSYYKVKDPTLKQLFQKNVHNNQYCTCDDVDYGKVKLKKDKRCPFLDDNNLCIIFSKLDESYLSNVCTSFPRIINKINNIYEMSLDVSCPEAAKIILSKEDGLKFNIQNYNLDKHILSSEIGRASCRERV